MHGHALGGAGGIEAVASLLPLVRGVLPPTINLDEPDDDAGLDHVAREARQASVEATLSNSFGFGGHNAALVLRAL
jgi:3-oxoacyl-(acyl-carrier-protein) synthase